MNLCYNKTMIDTHCHLNDDKFQDVDLVVKSFVRDGVDIAINMGCNAQSSEFGKELSIGC